MFAVASDVNNTFVKSGYPVLCFDAVAALSQAADTDLVFIQALEEHLEVDRDILR